MTHIGAQFLADLFGPSTANAVYVCSLPNDDANGEVGERHVATRELEPLARFIEKWDRPRRALYFCASATIQPGANRRAKDTLAELNGLHCDIDFKDVTVAPEELEQKLRQVLLLPSKLVASGHGLHGYWLFREGLPATADNIEHVEELLRLLADHLGGDLRSAEASRLLRIPGSHNSKGGDWTEVRLIADRPLRYDIDELEDWLTETSPFVHRKPAEGNGANGFDPNPWLAVADRFGFNPPIDVEQRLAAMRYQGIGDAAIHTTQVSVGAALLNRGSPIDEVVSILLAATRAAAGPFGERWNWRREERAIRKACETWIAKHPEVKERQTEAEAPPAGENHQILRLADWLIRDLPDPDFILGSWLTTTSRTLLVAPTGIGKTMLALAMAASTAAGREFLHWNGRRPARVLFVDGEMSRRLLRQRLVDEAHRLGVAPDGLHILSHDDIENFAPPKHQARTTNNRERDQKNRRPRPRLIRQRHEPYCRRSQG
jgi:hypothetical protein